MEDQSDTADPLSYIYSLSFFLGDVIYANITYWLMIIVLIFLSAAISSIDFAFSSLNNDSAESIKKSNLLYFKRITFLLHNRKKISVTFKLIRNVVSAAIAIISTYYLMSFPFFYNFDGGAVIILIFALSLVIISANEIAPRLVVQNPIAFLSRTFFISFSLLKLFNPISKFLLRLSIKRKIFKKTNPEISESTSTEKVKQEEEEEEEFEEERKEQPSTAKSLEALSLKKIMINRLDIQAFDWDTPFEEILKEINKLGFSRIPVYKENIDNIEGILYVKDLLIHIEEKGIFDWHSVIRPGFFIPESKKIDDLLKDFQDKKVHMAIIVDEYGGTCGLVTMEDILEEIVGDINDEFDQNQNYSYSTLDQNTFIFDGDIPLNEFFRIHAVEDEIVSAENGKTLSSFLLEQFASLPAIGEQIKFNKFEFTIIAVGDKNINRVKVYIQDQSNKEGQLV